jgi:DNA-binding LacI/PurR family transcriptional regulator
MASRKEVADRAGVSVAVVSYVLNNRSIVKEETRQRVLKAVKELGYQPNQLARGLKTKRSNQIAVLVNYLGNAFEAGLLLTIEHYFRARGYFVFFQTYTTMEEPELKSLFMGRVDGILLLGQSLQSETVEQFKSMGLPVVSIMQPLTEQGTIPYVDINWSLAMRKLVRHLQEQGHRRIGFMGGGQAAAHYTVRAQAFIEAIRLEGLSWHAEDLLDGGGRFEQAAQTLNRTLASNSWSFTALVCASDLMAAGCLSACREHGLKVPSQLAVAGCEDILMSSQTDPPLTVLHYPRRSLAESAAQMLLDELEGKPRQSLTVDAELVPRASTMQ